MVQAMYHANYQQAEDGTWRLPCLPFVLVGKDVNTSLLPAMHNNMYRLQHLNWSYSAIECQQKEDAQFQFDCLRMGHYRGMDVGFPYKHLAFQESDYASPETRASGQANVLVREESHICAYNTEGEAAILAVERQSKRCICGASVCVLGNTASSRAIATAALQMQANDVILVSESLEDAQTAIEKIQEVCPGDKAKISAANYEMLPMILPFSDIIINGANENDVALDRYLEAPGLFNSNHIIMDKNITSKTDKIFEAAYKASSQFFDGTEMFIEQAVLSVKIWSHVLGLDFEVDRDALRAPFFH